MTTEFQSLADEAGAMIDRAFTGKPMSAKTRILRRLLRGPASSSELSRICLRFGARIKELRDDDRYDIRARATHRGEYEYRIAG